MEGPASIGELLRQARERKGLTRETLGQQLNLSPALIAALEAGDWEALPRGQERPLARQVAERLGVDPTADSEAWSGVPGEPNEEAPDPGQDKMERVVMAVLVVGTLGLIAWLVLPGPSLRHSGTSVAAAPMVQAPLSRPALPTQPYPVVGEAIPEAPRTEEGLLVVLRAMDRCEARVRSEEVDLTRTLQVSEPWKLRVKGDFSIELDNAGVVSLEVAGKAIRHGQSVGEPFKAHFNANGVWLRPAPPEEAPPTSPETEPDKGL